jgi:hypothetical protein
MTQSRTSGGTGRCLCGAVQYRYEGEPTTIGLCQCDRCQRQSGSAFLIGVIFPKEAVTIESTLATYEAKITSSLKEDLTAGKTLRLASFGTASCEPEVEGQEARSAGHR